MNAKRETFYPSEHVEVVCTSDVDRGRYLDTAVTIRGTFAIAGEDREKFLAELGALVDRFRI